MDGLAPCSHEEADTRIFLHARNAAEEGSKVLMIKANDTDVLVITISALPALQHIGLQQLWMAFGRGQTLKWIPLQLHRTGKKAKEFSSSQAVMLYQDSVVKGRSQHGKFGMYVPRLLMSSQNSASIHQQ